MIYIFLKKNNVNFRGLFFLIVISTFSYCSNKTESNVITIDNIENKIEEAYKEAELKDSYEPLVQVIHFIDKNNLKFSDPCLEVKVAVFRSLQSYILEADYLKVYKFANNAILKSKDCTDNDLKVIAYNILGIYYLVNKNFEKAEEYYKLSILSNGENQNNPIVIDSYYNLVDIQINTKNWQQAIKTSEKAIIILNKVKTKQSRLKYFFIYKAQAQIYLTKYNLAEESLKDALNLPIVVEREMTQNEIDKFYEEVYKVYLLFNTKKGEPKLANNYSKLIDSLKHEQLLSYNNVSKDLLIVKNELTNKLNDSNQKIINRQKIILFGAIVFLIFTLGYLYRIFTVQNRLKLSLEEKEKLNNNLVENFEKLDISHKESSLRKKEIESILKFNEQSLFTKTLKISNYKDAVNNIIVKINKLVESNESIKSTKMHSINRSLQNIISEEEFWEDFKIEFEKNRPNFFKNLLERNNNLSIVEQKHCAYVAVNLKSKEVASILNLSPRSVETSRYRIKKKLKLEEISLKVFLKNI